jgi:putative membrane protein
MRSLAAALPVLLLGLLFAGAMADQPAGGPDKSTPAQTAAQTPSAQPLPVQAPSTQNQAPSAPSAKAAAGAPQMSAATKSFADEAAISDIFEIEAGTIAMERGQSKAVKDFGKKMVDAHIATTDQLQSVLAAQFGQVTPPTALDQRRQVLIDILKDARVKGTGVADFDHLYLAQQVACLKDSATLMRGYVADGDTAAVKAFAAETLTVIEEHLALADKLAKSPSLASN